MTEERLSELEGLKYPVAKEAAEFIRGILNSPFYDGYVTTKYVINRLNKEIIGLKKIIKEEDKVFEKVHKFTTEINGYYDQLEYFKNKLTPKQLSHANEEVVSLFEKAQKELKDEQ